MFAADVACANKVFELLFCGVWVISASAGTSSAVFSAEVDCDALDGLGVVIVERIRNYAEKNIKAVKHTARKFQSDCIY